MDRRWLAAAAVAMLVLGLAGPRAGEALRVEVDIEAEVGWVVGVDGFFDNDSDNVFVSVVLVLDVALFFSCLLFGGCGVCFSMESLILAQDERWRRA